jgi:hypothetical protein
VGHIIEEVSRAIQATLDQQIGDICREAGDDGWIAIAVNIRPIEAGDIVDAVMDHE